VKRVLVGVLTGCGALSLVLVLVAQIPATSLEGQDTTVKVHQLPLLEKIARFWIRHREFQRMAEEAAAGEKDARKRVLRLMEWTRKQVRPLPPGLPLIDDHISHIVLRHYGNEGQMAEVFTGLTTYTGNPGRWEWSVIPGGAEKIVLSFVQSDDGWWVFDVLHGAWFETQAGRIATVQDFAALDQLRPRGDAPETLGGQPYLRYFRAVHKVWERSFSRAEEQMPWPRLKAILGLGPA
jgi:hypothetical protein